MSEPGTPPSGPAHRDRMIAACTGFLVVLIAFLGADKPPPAGFAVVVVAAVVLAYLIAVALPRWRRLPGRRRLRRAALEGALTGIGMWLIAVLLPFSGEPTVAADPAAYLIGASVAAGLGAAVSTALARIAS